MFDNHTLAVWAAVTVLKAVLCVLSFRACSIFRLYIGWSLLNSLLLWVFAIRNMDGAYAFGYNYGSFVENLLMFAVIVHLAKLLFFPVEILPPKICLVGKRCLTVIAIGFVVNAVLCKLGSPLIRYGFAQTFERACFLVLLLLLVLAVMGSQYLQIPWRMRESWIALGLFCFLLISAFHHSELAYLMAEIVWAAGLIIPVKKWPIPTVEELEELARAARDVLGRDVQRCEEI